MRRRLFTELLNNNECVDAFWNACFALTLYIWIKIVVVVTLCDECGFESTTSGVYSVFPIFQFKALQVIV